MTTISKYLALAFLAAFLSVGCGKDDADALAKKKADAEKAAATAKADADKKLKETTDKLDKEKADAEKVAADKKADADKKLKEDKDKIDKAAKDAVEKLNAEVAALKTTAEGDLKPIEAKIATMKADADKATGDAKKDGEAKVADANGLLAKIKEQLASLGGLKDHASFVAVKEKVTGMISDLKKKVGL